MTYQPNHSAKNAVLFGLFSNLILVALKAGIGILGNSFALIADALESATDSVSSLMLYFGLKYAQRPPDENHPYGHGRFEGLLTFVVVFFLLSSAIGIGIQAIANLQKPQTLPAPFTLIALLGIVAWKETSFWYIRARARRLHSSLLEAEAWHHRADAISSIFGLIGIGLAWMLGPEFAWLDEAAALLSALVLLFNAYRIFRKAFSEFMDEDMYQPMAKEILEIGKELPFILGIPTCKIRKLGARYFVDLHVWVEPEISVALGHAHAHALKDKIKSHLPSIEDVLIHVEPVENQTHEALYSN